MKSFMYLGLMISCLSYAASIDDEIINNIEFYSMMDYLEEQEKGDINFEQIDYIASDGSVTNIKEDEENK